MNPYCWMRALLVALALAGLRLAGVAGDDAMAAALPRDACALLKPADVQALAPNAKIGGGVLTSTPPLGVSCAYSWGPRTNEWGVTALTVAVVDAAKAWPGGLSADDIKKRLLAEARTGGPDASQVPGIGDGAVFTTDPKSHDAKVKAYFMKAKGVLLEVTFHGGDAPRKEGQTHRAVEDRRRVALTRSAIHGRNKADYSGVFEPHDPVALGPWFVHRRCC